MILSLDSLLALAQPFSIGLAFWAFVSLILSMFPFLYGLRSAAYINAFVAYGLIAFFRIQATSIGSNWSLVFNSDRMKSALVFGLVGWVTAWGLDWAQRRFPLMPRWGFFMQFVVIGLSVLFLFVAVHKHLPV
jgi:hypothetical protein